MAYLSNKLSSFVISSFLKVISLIYVSDTYIIYAKVSTHEIILNNFLFILLYKGRIYFSSGAIQVSRFFVRNL